jgi:hypothetical protein
MQKPLTAVAILAMTGALSLTSGCIYYEGGCGEEEWECREDFGEWDTGAAGDVDGEEEVAVELAFSPNHAEQGEVFAAYVHVAQGEIDLSGVSELSVYGDAEVLSLVARPDQLVLIVEVAADAELGPVDVVVEMQDGDAELLPQAFTIFPAGSGNSASDGGADGGGDADGGDEDDCE